MEIKVSSNKTFSILGAERSQNGDGGAPIRCKVESIVHPDFLNSKITESPDQAPGGVMVVTMEVPSERTMPVAAVENFIKAIGATGKFRFLTPKSESLQEVSWADGITDESPKGNYAQYSMDAKRICKFCVTLDPASRSETSDVTLELDRNGKTIPVTVDAADVIKAIGTGNYQGSPGKVGRG